MSSVRFISNTGHPQKWKPHSWMFKTEDRFFTPPVLTPTAGVRTSLHRRGCHYLRLLEPRLPSSTAYVSCKAKRYRYANADMTEPLKMPAKAQAQRFRIIVTDGVFSMDGNVAPWTRYATLPKRNDALVMVDESPCRSGRRYGTWRERTVKTDVWTLHRHIGQSLRRRLGRFHHGPQKRLSTCCASAAVRICSPTHTGSGHHRCKPEVFKMLKEQRPARQVGRKRQLFPRQDDRRRFLTSSLPKCHLRR